ncbi:hypothetical protein A2Y85_04345 [candidate division WOR-3 bacterium RBG_13_43_14]|uniref:CheW-like domain-containing protein n=1 Tax=candidate division WOR-3 bacterium RBG_13_43_14 TaxID=1802590 RepID=A0A1F4UEJ9_UNCW3|nr:MAG: hypothetical protein A2Y85_04345 [candidate division WOR-3 bacterium RBG_13_43_14]
MDTLLVFCLNNELIGIDINKVKEVTESQDPIYVPGVPEYVSGVVNIRGDVVPVISLKKRLGMLGDEQSKLLLIVEEKGRIAGIRVDKFYGTKKVVFNLINRSSELISTKQEKDFFLGVYESSDKPILILNLDRALSKEAK